MQLLNKIHFNIENTPNSSRRAVPSSNVNIHDPSYKYYYSSVEAGVNETRC